MRFSIGVALIVASVVLFFLGLSRHGAVRRFLRNDQVQAYYTVAILGALVLGLLNVVLGLIAAIG